MQEEIKVHNEEEEKDSISSPLLMPGAGFGARKSQTEEVSSQPSDCNNPLNMSVKSEVLPIREETESTTTNNSSV